jgi:hypothetical protein
MFEATSRSELPNPQKALTKLTKAPLATPFVSFVSPFPQEQISKRTCCWRGRARRQASFTPALFHCCQPPGPARSTNETGGSHRKDPLSDSWMTVTL